jgi:hypothetical protein
MQSTHFIQASLERLQTCKTYFKLGNTHLRENVEGVREGIAYKLVEKLAEGSGPLEVGGALNQAGRWLFYRSSLLIC